MAPFNIKTTNFNPNPHGYIKVRGRAAGSYDSQATNRKQGRLPPPSALPLVAWNISPLAGWNTQKHHHKQVDVLTF